MTIAESCIIDEDDPRLVFVSLVDAAVPPSGLIEHFKDKWWVVHPTKGIAYWDTRQRLREKTLSPQFNADQAITRRLVKTMYPWGEAKLIDSVFRRISIRDYV